MERALRFLKPRGRFALVTQDTYVEKKWAGRLRETLSNANTLLTIIDLNPCGQLFFRAMNTPAITVVEKGKAPEAHKILLAVVTKPTGFEGLSKAQRRGKVLDAVRTALAKARKSGHSVVEFAEGFQRPQADFARARMGRWDLAPALPRTQCKSHFGWLNLGSLFETRQGVTPGGEGCLDLFLLKEGQPDHGGLEVELIHPVVKGLDLKPYRCKKRGQVILYPYTVSKGKSLPAFNMDAWRAEHRGSVEEGLRSLRDALDFSVQIDSQEKKYRSSSPLNEEIMNKILKHRLGLGIVAYPKVAAYLVHHYQALAGRVFEKKSITDCGKEWYEYHRPRSVTAMFAKPKLLSPRLTRTVRFTLDRVGIVPQDSCIALVSSENQRIAWQDFINQVSRVIGHQATALEALQVALAFANSASAQTLLVTGRRPTPKGSYQITDEFLKEIEIPPLGKANCIQAMIDDVGILCGKDAAQFESAQARIDKAVKRLVVSAEQED
jgi:hypothetical protein